MLRLEDTNLYKALINRSTNNSKYYSSFLHPLEHDMDELLPFIKKEYPDYPDHGLQHSIRIIEYIGKVLSINQIDELSDLEIFIFIIAALFHDTGMVLYNTDEKEKIRANHHCYAEKVISLYFNKYFENMSDKDRIKEAIVFTCYAHGLLLSDLTSDKYFSRTDTISYNDIRYKLLAFLLRIGDLMDLEGERANNFRMLIYSDLYSGLALNHNRRHQNVKLYNYSSNEINIEVEVENIQQYKIWHEWFTYLKEDILCANTHLKDTKISFPFPKTNIFSSNGNLLDIQELRFEIDEKGGIWEIISKSIYTNELDFVRELIQNAIDATLKIIYIDEKIKLLNASPRSWEVQDITEPILLCYSENCRKLYVIDQGIGMNKDDLQCFLFKVSSTGYVDNINRNFDFPGIAQYGIGFVSCLINAKKIQIYTSKKNDSKIHHVTMESDLSVAFIQNIANDSDFVGTVVELDLKQNFKNKDIVDYMNKVFYYTSVEIKFLNLDVAESVAKNLTIKDKFDSVIENPFLLPEFILKANGKVEKILNSLYEKKQKITKYREHLSELDKFFKEEYYALLEGNNLSTYNMQIVQLKRETPSDELKKNFPDIMLSTTQKSSNEHIFKEIISAMDTYHIKVLAEEGKYDSQISNFKLDYKTISTQQISLGDEWRYFVVFFNSEFEVSDVQYSLEPIKLSGKNGIILFKHSGHNFQHGIEYVAINGFLFQNGKIYNKLARFSGYTETKNYSTSPDSFIVGIDGDYYDVREEVNEYMHKMYYDDINEDYSEESSIAYKQVDAEYDEIYVLKNNFVRSNNQNVFKTRHFYDNEYDENFNLFEDLVEKNKKRIEDNIMSGLIELEECIIHEKNAYFQDGIALPSKMNNLFPIGLFRIVCNCTADARMKLNVTRHELSEIRSDIESWMNNTGIKLQEMLLDSLTDMLEEENLYFDFNELIDEDEKNDYFSHLSYQKLSYLLRTRKKK